MKKIFIILLSMCSFSGFSQTKKGDFVITPTSRWNMVGYRYITENSENLQLKLPIEFHKYLSDKFAVGLKINCFYNSVKYYVTNQFEQNDTQINISPEVRYNF